jgi:hypothetical protein
MKYINQLNALVMILGIAAVAYTLSQTLWDSSPSVPSPLTAPARSLSGAGAGESPSTAPSTAAGRTGGVSPTLVSPRPVTPAGPASPQLSQERRGLPSSGQPRNATRSASATERRWTAPIPPPGGAGVAPSPSPGARRATGPGFQSNDSARGPLQQRQQAPAPPPVEGAAKKQSSDRAGTPPTQGSMPGQYPPR